MPRRDGRRADELRPVSITRGYTATAPGSVLLTVGRTRVLCTACFEEGVPRWKEPLGGGWLTAEYDMLPTAGGERRARNRGRVDGRTQEIQRLIGRVLRAVVDLDALGDNSIVLDCDVIEADGGTRTASINGAYVALCDAVADGLKAGRLTGSPVREGIAAVSAGIVDGRVLLDLDYGEDSRAEVDFNVAMTASGRFVEIQGGAERGSFSRAQLDRILASAAKGIRQLLALQESALRGRRRRPSPARQR
jgi:ribonuclease PH